MMNKTTMLRFLNSLNKLAGNKKEYRGKSKLPVYLNDVLIGLLLSDGHLERTSPTSAVRLSVSFGAKHSLYLQHLYDLFERRTRSEEHTSELQSRVDISYAVFCLKK